MKPTRFICFYSYKGGTGRSMALANTAYLLALEGNRVLIVDMDLEAPGQHMTELFYEEQPLKSPGLLELLEDYQNHVMQENDQDFSVDLRKFVRRSSVFDREISEAAGQDGNKAFTEQLTRAGCIDLLPVVEDVNTDFQVKLAYWNWEEFYADYEGEAFFESLKSAMSEAGYDYVLIDSRTGMSDVFFITTLALADTVALVSSYNRQNIEGIRLAAKTLGAEHNVEQYGKKHLLFLLTPYPELAGADAIDRREDEIRQYWPELKSVDARLPYDPEMALHEVLLTRKDSRRESGKKTRYTEALQVFLIKLKQEDSTVNSIIASDDLVSTAEEAISTKCSNPFPAIRVEYWKEKDVVDYFVDPGGNIYHAMRQFMPTLLCGSRGTGKTILARWLSYETLAYRLKKDGKKLSPDNVNEPIGLWFRLDVDLLNVFNTSDENLKGGFDRLFGQFFDLLVLRKALEALECLGGISAWCIEPALLFRVLGREMGLQTMLVDASDFFECLEQRLAEIRAYINNPQRVSLPYLVQDNVLMKLLAEQLLHDGKFRPEHFFIVFVDEYENFHLYQQRIVNTRVKQVKESDRITYKLLARNDGLHTHDTLAKNQPIEVTHDFRTYNLDEGVEFKEFKRHVGRIVAKHLASSRYFRDRGYTDAEALLAVQKPEDEARLMAGKRGDQPLRNWLRKEHGDHKDLTPLLAWMDQEPNLLRRAVAVVLLNQGKALEKIVAELTDDSTTAKDWYHNYYRGALFWLGTLYKKNKTYAGFNDVVGVAGNNTRVAMDLFYAIIENWLAHDPDRLLPIAVNIQSNAIHTQSETYFRKLRDQREQSRNLYLFVERLGRLFQIIHKGPRQGEPEINHFVIEGEVSEKTDAMLKHCRNDAVLRWLPGNKQKGKADERRDAWQLHPRYAAFFDISWRRKKMLKLNAEQLETLFFGNQNEWKDVVKEIDQKYCSLNPSMASLSTAKSAQQSSLFDDAAD